MLKEISFGCLGPKHFDVAFRCINYFMIHFMRIKYASRWIGEKQFHDDPQTWFVGVAGEALDPGSCWKLNKINIDIN